MLGRSVRAMNCSTQKRPNEWILEIYRVSTWCSTPAGLNLSTFEAARRRERGDEDRKVTEEWFCNLLPETPSLPDRFVVQSSFFTNAPEINNNPLPKQQTFNFQGCSTWYEVGLQILVSAAWRPGCARADRTNLKKALPPRNRRKMTGRRGPWTTPWTHPPKLTQMIV